MLRFIRSVFKRIFLKRSYRLLYKRRCPPFSFELREYPPIERSIVIGHQSHQTTWYPYTQFLIVNPIGIPYLPPKVLHVSQTPKPLEGWGDYIYQPGVGNLYDLWRICTGAPPNTACSTYDDVVRFFWNSQGGTSTQYSSLEDALHERRWQGRSRMRLSQWVWNITGIPRFALLSWNFSVPSDYNRLTLNDTESIMEARKRAEALKEAKRWAESVAREERQVHLQAARRQAQDAARQAAREVDLEAMRNSADEAIQRMVQQRQQEEVV